MRDLLFDADAFLCIRKLSVLSLLAPAKTPWLMTSYVARHELSTVAKEVDAFCQSGRLSIHSLSARDARFRELLQKGHDKDEAEAIAWASQRPGGQGPLFISLDTLARKGAKDNGVAAGDVMDLIVEAVETGDIDFAAVREKASIWDDRRQVQGRPNDYTTFDETFEKRKRARRGQ